MCCEKVGSIDGLFLFEVDKRTRNQIADAVSSKRNKRDTGDTEELEKNDIPVEGTKEESESKIDAEPKAGVEPATEVEPVTNAEPATVVDSVTDVESNNVTRRLNSRRLLRIVPIVTVIVLLVYYCMHFIIGFYGKACLKKGDYQKVLSAESFYSKISLDKVYYPYGPSIEVIKGNIYENELMESTRGDEAFSCYMTAAKQGNKRGQLNVGKMYLQGKGVEQNPTEAINWLNKACNHGYGSDMICFGDLYLDGTEIVEDKTLAFNWYKKTTHHLKKAAYWYTKSAEQGYEQAQNNIGMMYRNGYGVEKDVNIASEWYEKAEKNRTSLWDFIFEE